MILVDSSVWVDHFRNPSSQLTQYLDEATVLSHPFIVGELVVGSLKSEHPVVRAMHKMPQALVASHIEFMTFLEHQKLSGLGLSFVDVHLLTATALTPDALLWTRDRRLHQAAVHIGLGWAS